VLARYDNEQSDLLTRIQLDKALEKLPLYKVVVCVCSYLLLTLIVRCATEFAGAVLSTGADELALVAGLI
jgi:hypothetical protein